MLQEILIELYERDLGKLRSEIEEFSNEDDLWKISGDITNSAGNLCQHLLGNLQHFIGAIVGESGYVRDRDSEFASRNASKEELLREIEKTRTVVKETLSNLNDDDFSKIYPIEVFGKPITTGFFLTHLTTHFSYHLGQINYHRRLLAKV
jgi:uncharacterized damage-inducible protein DinB